MIEHLVFKNFKALRNVSVPLAGDTRLHVLVGPNASGKSSVLEGAYCLTRLGTPWDGESDHPLHRPGLVFAGVREPGKISTSAERTGFRLQADLAGNDRFSVEARLERPGEPQAGASFVLDASWAAETLHLEVPENRDRARDFFRSPILRDLGSAALLSLDARALAEPAYAETETPRIESDGEGLASALAFLAQTDMERIRALEEDLRSIVPQARRLRMPRAQVARRERETLVVNDQPVTRWVERTFWGNRLEVEMLGAGFLDARLLSDGTLLALGLLTMLHAPTCPRLVLLDDLEHGLHPTAQTQLVQCLRAILERRPELQIVCTSHSPYVLDSFDPDEVVVMNLDAEGHAVCRQLIRHPDWERWKGMMESGEFWSSVGESWLVENPEDE